MGILDPSSRQDPGRDEQQKSKAARVEIRPASRVAHLATGSLACPDCAMPLTTDVPLDWTETIACGFCGERARTSEFIRKDGWPPVDVIARLD